MISGICSDCEKQSNDLFIGIYQHPNAERYIMELCEICKPKHEQWRVNRVKL
jgi:hypothetical protein